MRITALRLAGFGPYRQRQEIDFARFDADGIFLITGRTGAGKSSILDAVCFALYADVPRYDGRERQVRSQHCALEDPSEVELDFVIGDAEYRIRRTPRYERAKRTGSGTTVSEPEAALSVRDGAGWRPLAVRPKEVAAALTAILPIRRDQFLQVILLAQGRFQQFLLAPTDERRALLRTLFGTSRFERLELDLLERRKQLGQQVVDAEREIALRAAAIAEWSGEEAASDPDAAWFADARERAAAAAGAAAARLSAERAAADAAEAALRAAETVRDGQRRWEDARARLAALEAAEPEVTAARQALEAAVRAEGVWPLLLARDTAEEALEVARTERERAALPPGTAEDADRVLTVLGVLEHPLALEDRLPALRAEAARLDGRARAAAEAVTVAEAAQVALPARIAGLDAALRDATAVAATTDGLLAALAALEAAHTAAVEAAALEPRLREARLAEAAASTAHRAAADAADELVQRRLQGWSFELAAGLAPGEACPVCGATEHPRPATTDAPPITAEDVRAARTAVAEAAERLAAAAELAADLERRQAVAAGASGGRAPELLEPAVREAAERLGAARSAADRRDTLLLEQRELASEAQRLGEELLALRRGAQEAAAVFAAGERALTEAAARVEAAREGRPSVRDRVEALQAELAAIRRREAADRAVEDATRDLVAARAALEERLAALGFADAEAVRAARLPTAEAAATTARVRRHDDERAAALGVLREPALAALPVEPVDPEPFRREAAAARERLDAAIAERSRLASRSESVGEAAAAALGLLQRTAVRRAEYRQLRDLAATVHGDEPNTRRMRLETYVLAAQLEQILAAANQRLARMTSGRYALDLDDERQHRNVETGLGIGVRDSHTGQVRQAVSLSGGEMFLASLALALGLAEVVSAESGGVALDTLFVDEGFGSLDGETLDVAMAALDDLRAGGRTIGLISHVESMQERIPAKLAVEVLPTGESRVVQQAA